MPEPVMTDKDVIDLVRKEFQRKLDKFCDDQGIALDDDVEESPEDSEDDDEEEKSDKPRDLNIEKLSSGLRIRHIDSGLEYPIVSINKATGEVELKTGEGNYFTVPFQELEQEYELD